MLEISLKKLKIILQIPDILPILVNVEVLREANEYLNVAADNTLKTAFYR